MSDELLDDLNPHQREGVTTTEGPLLLLAGAGSGKTRVLTRRLAYLVREGLAQPHEILAVTFTNKAAQEMKDRVNVLLKDSEGNEQRNLWVMTFHSLCVRILRQSGQLIGLPSTWNIVDAEDSRSLVRQVLKEKMEDDETPEAKDVREAQSRISRAKNAGLELANVSDAYLREVWTQYEIKLRETQGLDFDDLLTKAVDVLKTPEGAEYWGKKWKYMLVDEVQDVNQIQDRICKLLAEHNRNLCVVGDDSQCVLEGTKITMGDGSLKSIEKIQAGDQVMSCYGSGDFRPSSVLRVNRSNAKNGISITLRSGKQIVSTPEHTHFAGYRPGYTPQAHMTYLMFHRSKGFRVGTSRIYTDGRNKGTNGVAQRTNQEAADASWVIGTHSSEAEARIHEMLLSLQYGLPTIPFQARINGRANGIVDSQELIDKIFGELDTNAAGMTLLRDEGLDFTIPHFLPRSHEGRRRIVTVTLCADRRGQTPMHFIAMGGRDLSVKAALEGIGLNVREAKPDSQSWRYETVFKDFANIVDIVERVEAILPVRIRYQARFGRKNGNAERNNLPFTPAGSVRVGMVMFDEKGDCDVVENVERVLLSKPVYDIDVQGTHNYVASGICTHNSVYAFRGAEVEHIMQFKDRWPDAKTIKLEHNYRSTPEILEAANAVIEHNVIRLDKILRPTRKTGDVVTVRKCPTTWDEAEAVGYDIQKEGLKPEDVAIVYRTNAQSRTFEEILNRRGIPYHVVGGVAFLNRAEVKTVRAYLNLVLHPRDRIAFRRVIENPRRGVGPAAQEILIAYAVENKMHLIKAAANADKIPSLSAKARTGLLDFARTYQEVTADTEQSLQSVVRGLITKGGYLPALKKAKDEDAIENIGELVSLLRSYDEQDDITELTGKIRWLEHAKQFLEYASLGDTSAEKKEGVALMTIHATKGLEFPRVYLVGLEEELFFREEIHERELEEARRLLYVGMTRAKERLVMSYCAERVSWGRTTAPHVLRFLKDLPASVKKVALKGNPNRRQQAPPMREKVGSGRPGSRSGGSRSGQPRSSSGGSSGSQQPVTERVAPQAPLLGLTSGTRVSHAKFGVGTVVRADGGKAVIRFSDLTRILDTRYAKLEVL